MKILVLGDTHGDAPWIARACKKAAYDDCKAIVQLGDFGYWSHTAEGETFLDQVTALLVTWRLEMFWLDGNHENHKLLRSRFGSNYKAVWDTEMMNNGPMYEIRDNLYYLPRGTRWTWDEVKFMALGGADSIDKQLRRPGTSWWAEEAITDEEVEYAVRGAAKSRIDHSWGRHIIDVMFTHDAPYARHQDDTSNQYDRKYPLSKSNKLRVRRVMDTVRPKLLVHGHQHRSYELHIGDTLVKGLGMNGDPGSMWILDTEDLKRND